MPVDVPAPLVGALTPVVGVIDQVAFEIFEPETSHDPLPPTARVMGPEIVQPGGVQGVPEVTVTV